MDSPGHHRLLDALGFEYIIFDQHPIVVDVGPDGHAWEVCVQQHKGINFVEVRRRDDGSA